MREAMSATLPRFPLLAPDEMSERQKEVVAAIAGGPRGAVRGPFLALIHHPDLAQHLQQLGEHLRFGTGMPPALVELAVLVTARHWSCQYEWHAHARIARTTTDLPEAVIQAIAEGRTPDFADAGQAMVHAFCQDTLRKGEPDAAVYDAAVQRFGRQGVLDLLSLCGYYSLLAMVLNTARIPLPEGTPPPLRPLEGTRA
jgi:4-carboxymuconolactone decarboxylase